MDALLDDAAFFARHAAVERDLHELGVQTVAIPRQATISAAPKATEHSRGFWQACQVAHRLRRADQLPQALIRLGPHPPRRQDRSRNLVRHGVFARNLVKISALTA